MSEHKDTAVELAGGGKTVPISLAGREDIVPRFFCSNRIFNSREHVSKREILPTKHDILFKSNNNAYFK